MATALRCLALVAVSMAMAYEAGAQALTFQRPPAQGPGTPGFKAISDPTIRPFLLDGVPAYPGVSTSIDLQGNGRPDFMMCHSSPPDHPPSLLPCRVLRPQPDGSVVEITRQLFGAGALPSVIAQREIVSGDFNHDGRQDVFIAGAGYDAPPFGGEINVLLISNADGTYTDRSSTLPQAPDLSHSACVGDIDGDGHLDIYVGNVGGSPIGPYFLMGRGDGTFTQKISGLPPTMSAGVFDNTNLPGGNFELFLSSALVDIDQDGYPDLVLGIAPNAYVDSIVLFNDGTGDFTKRPRFRLPPGPLATQVGMVVLDIVPLDVNRDGRPDLLLLSSAAVTDTGFGMQVLINRGDGTLVDEPARLGATMFRTTGPWFPFIHLADFNGDGWEDIYLDTISHEDRSIHPRVWLNSGTGTWNPVAPAALPPEFFVALLHAVDFDGDGRPDILQVGGTPVLLPDLGYRSFLNRTARTVPSTPLGVTAIAGSTQATIVFAPPFATGTSPITRYDATCGPGHAGTSAVSPVTVSGLTNGRPYACTVTARNLAGVSAASEPVTVTPSPQLMALERTSLAFSAVTTGAAFTAATSAQAVRLLQLAAGPVTWTASSTAPWLRVSPASGTGSATLTMSVRFAPGLTSSQTGRITVAFNGTGASLVVVTLKTKAPTAATAPIGSFDTPTQGITGVAGSIAVTGWAIDDLEVRQVRLLRDPVVGEGTARVFIGAAVRVDGARPDVAALFPTWPRSTLAGWGYLMLTNFLPNHGNGTFKLYAYADDADGHTTLLGTRTITCDNAHATTPFGAIDTPLQGELVSGSVNNFGWVLAPGSARADVPGGGTVSVVIDGAVVGTPAGWTNRPDLTTLFPTGFSSLSSALAVLPIDTAGLTNGVHTIAWGVMANNGQSAGVGSRYFTVANGSGLQAGLESSGFQAAVDGVGPHSTQAGVERPALLPAVRSHPDGPLSQRLSLGAEVNRTPVDSAPIGGRRGYDLEAPFQPFPVAASGRTIVSGEELDRFELRLSETGGDHYSGYMRVGTELHALPIGSHIDPATGVFTWAPGVGFVRSYDLVFVRWTDGRAVARREVRFILNPRGSNRVGPQVTIDTPTATATVGRSFSIGGWAIDLDDRVGTGIDTLHVWAYPAGGGLPIFVGSTAYGTARPDVATIYGDRFTHSGYGLIVDSLPPGQYDLAVFAWSTVKDGFVPAKVVRVTVR